MRDVMKKILLAVALVGLSGWPAHAASQAILGRKLLVKDPTGAATSRKLVGLGKESGSPNNLVGNPTGAGATLRVVLYGTTDSDQTFTLSAGGWTQTSTGFKYSNRVTGGAVKKVIIKKSGGGVFSLKVLVKGSDGPVSVVPPNLADEGGFILNITGGDSYCVSFGGAAGGIETRDDAKIWRIKNATAEACPLAFCPPSTAYARVISAPADLIDGPMSRGEVGDFLLANDRIQVVIQKPGRVMFGIGTYGGNIIDADLERCNVNERDHFEEISPLVNIENTGNFTSVAVLNDGTNGMPAVVRATGPDDLLDFINPSTVVTNFGFMFPADQDDRNLPVDVQTDYILETGNPYVRIETTLTNTGATPLQVFFGDIMNGSGEVEIFQSAYGLGEPLITDECNASTYQPCTAGTCDLCNFVAYTGEDGGAGVSYGYMHGFNGTTSFSTSGVSVPLLGVRVVLALIGAAMENFSMGPAGLPGDAVTITRYFAVADGTVGAIVDIRNALFGIANTGTITGTVTEGGVPLAGAEVAVLGSPFVSGPTQNVVDHFRTAADGTYRGTLPAGNYTVRANKDGRTFGTPDPAAVTITAGATTTQDFALTNAGLLRVVVTDEAGDPIPAKVQLVGFDPSPESVNTHNVLGLIAVSAGVFSDLEDSLVYGISFVTFADKTGDTGPLPVEPGMYQLVVSRGARYSVFKQNVTITGGSTTTVNAQIARVVDTTGFISGDFHVHALDSPDSEVTKEERVATELAEGVDFFTPSDHDFRADFTPVIAAMGVGSLISTAPSAEITTFDYGHFNSWPVTIDPGQIHGGGVDFGRAGIAPGMDFPSLGSYNLSPAEIYAAAAADPLANLTQINHIRSFFNHEGLDIDTAEGGVGPPTSHTPPLARRLNPGVGNFFFNGFDAYEVWIGTDGRNGDLNHFVGETLGDWLNLLNQGITPTGVADSDTHQKRTTQINARTYVASTVTDPGLLVPEAENLAASVVAGKAIGTNAPFVTISASATSTGETAGLGVTDSNLLSTTDGNVDVTVTVKSPLWAEFDKLQFFVNAAPQPYDHDADSGTRMRYRALANNMCLVASGCIERVAPTHFTVSVIDDFPLIPDAKHLEATYVLNLTGLTEDSWLVLLVRGTDGVSEPLFPVLPNSIKQSTNMTLAQLTDGNLGEDGVVALAFTNPIFIDADGTLGWVPPGVTLTPP